MPHPAPELAQADLDDFEDLEIEDPSLLAATEGPSGGNEEEEEIKPMDAFQLTVSELMAEMERKGLHAKGCVCARVRRAST